MKWVTAKKLSELTGLTLKGIDHRRERGIWLSGIHWKKMEDGRIWYNAQEIEKWVDAA